MSGRFSERVEFGDEIETRIWQTEPGEAVVQAVTQNGDVVLSQARATFKI